MRNTLISILVCCLATPIPGVALAQDGDDDAEVVLDEIIVLTTRREESVMDVPFSIQAIPETVLELPTFNDMADVVNLVPGATGYGQKPPFHLGVQFRGSGIIQNISGGLSPVGYYVDDIPYVDISTPTPPPMSTFDLQQVEIVRGPQGTSWGQDSSAGSVIMRTNPVDLQNFGYKTRVAVSDVMHYSGTGFTVGGVLNMPIAEDVFGIRLSYLREDDPGHGTVVGRPDIENPLESSRDTIRLKAFWQASDKIDVEFTYSLWDTEYGITPSTQIVDSTGGWLRMNTFATPIMTTKFPDGIVKNSYEITWTTLRASFDLGFAELTSSTGFVDTPNPNGPKP
ncbi:MAG: TonB-dependent receptor plug domain-containing protein, partial [Pseudomonadota bacterium]